jgi:hypothetical protein
MNDIARLKQIKKKVDAKFLPLEGVNGSAIKMKDNEYCIVIYVKKINPDLKRVIPKEIDGVGVCIEEMGEIKAL